MDTTKGLCQGFLHYHPCCYGPSRKDLEIFANKGVKWLVITTIYVFHSYKDKILWKLSIDYLIKAIKNKKVQELLKYIKGAFRIIYIREGEIARIYHRI